MAEPVYKKITELDVLSGALDGNETLPVVKSGKTYRRSWANLFGSGWITSLLGAFTAFKAPDSDHADDADTVGGETAAQLHAAASLTGNIHLDRVPAELTGKNAETATLAATASACSGNAATATNADKVDGMHRETYTFNVPAAGADVTISIPVGRFSKIKALSGSFDAGTAKYPFNMTAADGSRTMTISVYATSSDILRITSSTTLAGGYVGRPGVVVVDYTD